MRRAAPRLAAEAPLPCPAALPAHWRRMLGSPLAALRPPPPHPTPTPCSLVHDIIGKHSDLMAMFNEFLMRCEVGPDDPYTRQYPRDRNRVSVGVSAHSENA